METSTTSDRPPLIDVRHNGMGDVVVASWIVHSALAVGQRVRINAHDQPAAASILSVPADLLEMVDALHWRSAAGEAHRLECAFADGQPMSRFDAWCQNAGLPPLEPVRPPYDERVADGAWADEQWQAVDPSGTKPRVLIFPEAAWHIRMWPYAYFIDLAAKLVARGYAVAACAGSSTNVQKMPCHWWGGFTLRQVAAMARRATLVIANDSGPAHLAGAIGTRTLALCGASHPAVVFAHDPNVRGVTFDKDALPCVGCHFSYDRGYRPACNEGCQAMMRLDPDTVAAIASAAIEETAGARECVGVLRR